MNSEYIKKIQALWQEVLEGKKKLDPVGKADADIDNDGDVDSSDEYLHKRRKAIGKAMKKEDVELEEASTAFNRKELEAGNITVTKDKNGYRYLKNKSKGGAMGPYHNDQQVKTAIMQIQKESVELEEATGKDIAAKMMRSKTMKPFASKVAKMAKVSAGDLERMLPDYVSGGEIRKLFNESVNEELWKEIETYAKKHGGIDKNDMMKVAMMLKKGDRKGAVKYARGLDTDPRDWLLDKMDEAVELDEVSAKLARKAAAASQAKSFEYGSSAYGPGSDKETDRLDKKADKARAHVQKRQGDKGVKKVDRMTGKLIYGRNEAVDMDTKSVDKALSHDCAKHVASEQWGFGECIPGQHTLVEQEDGNAIVTHYDVMFEHGVEFDVSVEDLEILVSESHKHTAKKKMKEGATYADRTKGASKAETMKDKFKGKAALDMAKDANMDNPELAADDAKGHEDATKAGRAVKGQAPARPGEKRMGDKSILRPVKGAVTSTTGKEG